jgi:hypothetical protein
MQSISDSEKSRYVAGADGASDWEQRGELIIRHGELNIRARNPKKQADDEDHAYPDPDAHEFFL